MLLIALTFILWAVVHSILASLTVKAWVVKLFGEGAQRWYRLFFVIFAAVSIIPLGVVYYVQPDTLLYQVGAPWRGLMRLGQVASLLALVVTTWQSGLFQFIGLQQVVADPQHFTGRLVTTGLFRYIRHPLYLFSMLFLWLSPTMTQNQLVLYGLMTLYFALGSIHEEQILASEFGVAYLEYKKQVPRFIPLPGWYFQNQAD